MVATKVEEEVFYLELLWPFNIMSNGGDPRMTWSINNPGVN